MLPVSKKIFSPMRNLFFIAYVNHHFKKQNVNNIGEVTIMRVSCKYNRTLPNRVGNGSIARECQWARDPRQNKLLPCVNPLELQSLGCIKTKHQSIRNKTGKKTIVHRYFIALCRIAMRHRRAKTSLASSKYIRQNVCFMSNNRPDIGNTFRAAVYQQISNFCTQNTQLLQVTGEPDECDPIKRQLVYRPDHHQVAKKSHRDIAWIKITRT